MRLGFIDGVFRNNLLLSPRERVMTWTSRCFWILLPHFLSQSRDYTDWRHNILDVSFSLQSFSAPFIVLVVTIIHWPVQNHIRTIYISRYINSTTRPSQPIDTTTILHNHTIISSTTNIHHTTQTHLFLSGFQCPLSDTAPTNKICRRASSEQYPRTRPAATGEFFVELRSIKASHAPLCLWLGPSHLTCLL